MSMIIKTKTLTLVRFLSLVLRSAVQDEGTARALRLAQYVNVPVYIVHVMSGGAVAEIAAAKTRGQRIVGEAVASGFGADEAKIWDPDFKVTHLLEWYQELSQWRNLLSLRLPWPAEKTAAERAMISTCIVPPDRSIYHFERRHCRSCDGNWPSSWQLIPAAKIFIVHTVDLVQSVAILSL
jgi:hypothetical protein